MRLLYLIFSCTILHVSWGSEHDFQEGSFEGGLAKRSFHNDEEQLDDVVEQFTQVKLGDILIKPIINIHTEEQLGKDEVVEQNTSCPRSRDRVSGIIERCERALVRWRMRLNSMPFSPELMKGNRQAIVEKQWLRHMAMKCFRKAFRTAQRFDELSRERASFMFNALVYKTKYHTYHEEIRNLTIKKNQLLVFKPKYLRLEKKIKKLEEKLAKLKKAHIIETLLY